MTNLFKQTGKNILGLFWGVLIPDERTIQEIADRNLKRYGIYLDKR